MTKKAADTLFQKTNYRPENVDVVELHDCFSANELISYEALGLCPPGKAGELIDSGDNTYGGQYVINPSGGLISKGHPLGATGEYTYFLFSQHLKCFSGMFSSIVHIHSIPGITFHDFELYCILFGVLFHNRGVQIKLWQ